MSAKETTEFDYDNLTPEQQDLYCFGFNRGSQAAWEQARAEAAAAVAEARAPLVEALEGWRDYWRECLDERIRFKSSVPFTPQVSALIEKTAAALAAAKETP